MANKNSYDDFRDLSQTVTIASSATESSVIDTNGMVLKGINLPSTFDGTSMTFKSCNTPDGTFQTIQNDAGDVFTLSSLAASVNVRWSNEDFAGDRYIKLVAGTTQTSTDTVIELVLIGK